MERRKLQFAYSSFPVHRKYDDHKLTDYRPTSHPFIGSFIGSFVPVKEKPIFENNLCTERERERDFELEVFFMKHKKLVRFSNPNECQLLAKKLE